MEQLTNNTNMTKKMTIPSDFQVFCAAYELHFLRPFTLFCADLGFKN